MALTNKFDIVKAIANFKKVESNQDAFNYIPAVKYQDIIQEIFTPLHDVRDTHLICPAIVLNNREPFYMSNDPILSISYIASGLFRADNYFLRLADSQQSMLFTNQHDSSDLIQTTVLNILEEHFRVYNTYGLIRRCDDCTLVIGVANKNPIDDVAMVYKSTITEIENLTISYFDRLIGVYIEQLPQLKYSRFAKDRSYRASVIRCRRSHEQEIMITERETECLYWVSRGKTSSEIGLILDISGHTVNEHKKSIIKKMNVSNITQAIREAIALGFII